MLSNMLIFWKSELGYAYKRYAYKKKSVYDITMLVREVKINFLGLHMKIVPFKHQ